MTLDTGRPAAITCPVAAAAGDPDRAAVVASGAHLGYRELHRRSAAMMAELVNNGIGPGDRVGLLLAPQMTAIALLWALWRLGAVACPVSSRLPAGAVTRLLGDIHARVLVTDRPWSGERVRTLDAGALAPTGGTPDIATTIELTLHRPATVLFTSGSTGYPKAVPHTIANHYYSALGANQNLPLATTDRWLLSLPLFHAGGLAVLWRTALAGAAVALAEPAASLEDNIAATAPTHLSVVPTQLWRLMNGPDRLSATPQTFKAILVGGDAAPPELLAKARACGLPVVTTYGCTEAASQVTATGTGDALEALRTSGRILDHRELRIADDGEILVRGKTLARGYLEGHDVVPFTDADGWFHTGDLGVLDADARLVVAGRRDNLFISGGENIHPETIEAVLNGLAGVARGVVVGLPDPEFGHRPVAFVEMQDGSRPEIGRIRSLLEDSGRLARFMLPVRVLPWPLDVAPAGIKPDRSRLKALARRVGLARENRE